MAVQAAGRCHGQRQGPGHLLQLAVILTVCFVVLVQVVMKLFEHFDRDKDDSIDEGARSAAACARFFFRTGCGTS